MEGAEARDTPQLIRLLVDHVPSMLAYWDLNERCRFANRAYERWFGVDPDALVGNTLRDLLGAELYALNEPYIRGVLAGRQQVFERTVPGRDGVQRDSLATYVPDIVDGRVEGFVAHVTEVTPLKRAEAALREEIARRERAHALLVASERALRESQRLGQIGSWEWEVGPDVVRWSEQLYEIFGLDPSQPPPSYAGQAAVFEPAGWAAIEAAVGDALRSGEPYRVEAAYRRTDGRSGWVECRGEAVRDAQGAVAGLRGTVQEITTRRRMQEARIQLEVAESTSRNKTALMSRVSHELRTPLNAIIGFAQLCREDPTVVEKHRKWAEVIATSGTHMLSLVNELLELAAAETGHITVQQVPVDVVPLLQSCLEHLAPIARDAGVALVCLPGPPPLRVRGDPVRLRQVLDNLVSNAIKYTPRGGRVEVAVRPTAGERVEIAVEDTGVGLSEAQIERLFVPFERLGAEYTRTPGTGLGLVLTRQFVELMRGTIAVTSRVGLGTCFVVSLAAVPSEPA